VIELDAPAVAEPSRSAALGGYTAWAIGGTPTGRVVRVVIPEGASGREIAARLERADVIRSALMFRLVTRLRGVELDLKPGAYDLRTGLGVSAAIERMRKGVPLDVVRFTIPEGKTVRQTAEIVARSTQVDEAAFLRAACEPPVIPTLLPESRRGAGCIDLEGFLFPKTYEIVTKSSARDVVSQLVQQFEKEIASLEVATRARALEVTPYEALIVASLVEREARTARDRPLVASVIYNRLARGMRLQIDATVQYAIELETGRYKGTLLQRSDYTSVRSPYNTYLRNGLPPGPIASPGIEALRAALNPARTGYYFYVLCDRRGGHAFARSSPEFGRLVSRCSGVPH
jgi:UPF0755 protein